MIGNLFEEQAKLEALARKLAEQSRRAMWAQLQAEAEIEARAEDERRRMADLDATRAAHSYNEDA